MSRQQPAESAASVGFDIVVDVQARLWPRKKGTDVNYVCSLASG